MDAEERQRRFVIGASLVLYAAALFVAVHFVVKFW
jgi:hypothetical protein